MSNAVAPAEEPSGGKPAPGPPQASPHRLVKHSLLGLVGCLALATLWSFYQNPRLPQHLAATELKLDAKGKTLSFDRAHIKGLCLDGKFLTSSNASLTLDYAGCETHKLQVIPLVRAAAVSCQPPEGSVVVQVSDPSDGCRSQFLLVADGPAGVPRSFLASAGLRIVLEAKASLLRSTHVAAIAAQGASAVNSDSTALLGDAQGQLDLAGSAMRLEKLAVDEGAVYLDFDEADMGIVTTARLNSKDRLLRWRFEQFVIALVALLSAINIGPLVLKWVQRRTLGVIDP